MAKSTESAAILFSGGTDSTCAAALVAERFPEVHLLNFYERATSGTPAPLENVDRLRAKFPQTRFELGTFSVDRLVEHFAYDRYGHYLRKHRWLVLANPGFSSLSWHLRTLLYCRMKGIRHVFDGLTRELMHFPGHMDPVIALLKNFYAEFGIEYSNPVRDWETPPDQQLIERVIVRRSGSDFAAVRDSDPPRRTTGRYLHELGLMPHPNVKGSRLDRLMQRDCYPFILYNILAFWIHLPFESYERFSTRIEALMRDKINDLLPLVRAHLASEKSELGGLL